MPVPTQVFPTQGQGSFNREWNTGEGAGIMDTELTLDAARLLPRCPCLSGTHFSSA